MNKYKKNLHNAAKTFLLLYFSDGKKRQPGDFDIDIIGGLDTSVAFGSFPRWNKTPFFNALSDLIEEGKIKWWNDDKGHYYQLNKKDKQ